MLSWACQLRFNFPFSYENEAKVEWRSGKISGIRGGRGGGAFRPKANRMNNSAFKSDRSVHTGTRPKIKIT